MQPSIQAILRIGSPIEFLLESKFAHLDLPDGAAKHLLAIVDEGLQMQLATLLHKFKDVCSHVNA